MEFLALVAENRKLEEKVATLENKKERLIERQISLRKSPEPIKNDMP